MVHRNWNKNASCSIFCQWVFLCSTAVSAIKLNVTTQEVDHVYFTRIFGPRQDLNFVDDPESKEEKKRYMNELKNLPVSDPCSVITHPDDDKTVPNIRCREAYLGFLQLDKKDQKYCPDPEGPVCLQSYVGIEWDCCISFRRTKMLSKLIRGPVKTTPLVNCLKNLDLKKLGFY